MPFGLYNDHANFTILMNLIFFNESNELVVINIHDIWSSLRIKKKYKLYLKLVLKILIDNQFYSNMKKMIFFLEELKFLGHIVNKETLMLDPKRIEISKIWEVPKTQKEVRSLLGLKNHYIKFITNFSKIASPFTSFLKKDKKTLK